MFSHTRDLSRLALAASFSLISEWFIAIAVIG